MIYKERPEHIVDLFMDIPEPVGPFLSPDHLNPPEESCFISNTDSYQAIDAVLNMLSDKDPLLPSSSEPFRLELQAEALRLGDVGAVITTVEDEEHEGVSGLQVSSQNSSNSEPNPVQPNRKSPRLHTPVAVVESKVDENKDQSARIIHPSSKEFKKTWGFRQTTIAKRENAMDAENSDTALSENSDQLTPLLRRSRRQTQRSVRVQEFISAAQKRYRRMTGLDDGGECGFNATSEAGTGSDGSVDVDEKGAESLDMATGPGSVHIFEARNEVVNSDEDSSTNSDSDELTLKELQNQLRKRRGQEQPDSPQSVHTVQETCTEENQSRKESKSLVTVKMKKKIVIPVKKGTKSGTALKEKESISQSEVKSETDDDESSVNQSDNEYNDPDKLYCICRQPHNNRFMICCDRCEEWFHGDCVGITMARGRLLERNGEDYICPDCSPSPSKGSGTTEMRPGQQESKSVPASSSDPNSTGEKRDGNALGDQGIKGRIEKAVNPSGKKKIKIFKPAMEIPPVPKCIGPGCANLASTDSVYCSSACILKHAAATMKSLSQAKDQKQKTKGKSKTEKVTSSKSFTEVNLKPLATGPQKIEEINAREISTRKLVVLVHKSPMPPQKETVSSDVARTWTIDHNYNAVKPEKTLISTSVFYKSFPKDDGADPKQTASESPDEQPPTTLQSISSKPSAAKHPAGSTEHRVAPKRPIPASQQLSSSKQQNSSKPQTSSKHPISTKQQTSSKQGSSTLSEYRIPSKHSASAAKHTVYSCEQPPAKKSADKQAVQPSAPVAKNTSQLSNPQIRHNIRRSLKEILCKRVNDCDDIDVTEDTIGKIAVSIEKELFTLFQDTHSKYKSRYRSIMFNLKNPRNQGLFRRVVREEIVPFYLVRMSPEEIESKELAVWEERESRSAQEQSERLQHETKGSASRAANIHEVDMEEAPPMSDADEQEDMRPAQKTSHPLLDIFSSMLKDTTDEHRAHLFDLNCRICTGKVQVSEDEPIPKKPKVVTKKIEPKTKSRPDVRRQHEQDKATVTVSARGENRASNQEMTSLPTPSVVSMATNAVTSQSTSESVTNSFRSPANNPTGVARTDRASITVGSSFSASIVPKPILSVYSAGPTFSESAMRRTFGAEEEEAPKSILTSAAPKSILTKPSTASEKNYTVSTVRVSEAKTPAELDTSLFLSNLDAIWKGFINMHGVAKFVTKAYPVSGSIDYLLEDLPDTIHIGGRISPHTVWDYVGKLKSSLSKEVCLIRFHPATEEEEVTYISLYSYFNSRGRFGVVANNARHIKDLYLIPLAANDPIPSKLLPFEGPGLERKRPSLILGLVIRQKGKRRGLDPEAEAEKGEPPAAQEKRSRGAVPEELEVPPVLGSRDARAGRSTVLYGEGPLAATPPGSPPPEPGGEAMPAPAKASSSAKQPAGSKATPTAPAKVANPLQHILQTLFGGKKSFEKAKDSPDSPVSTPEPEAACATPLLDPIVQQFGQLKEEKATPEVEDDDNRPYDPEEEYQPEADRGYDLEDAYDPADETILEEAMVPVGSEVVAGGEPRARGMGVTNELYLTSLSAPSLQEQQKMLETLNQQIEEQTREVQEQEEALRQQRAAVGVSMACFSVSDALMSPPPKSSSFKPELFEVPEAGTGQLPELEGTAPSALSQMIDQSRDPRQAAVRRLTPTQTQSLRSPAPGDSAALPVDQPLPLLYNPTLNAPYLSPRLQEVAAMEVPVQTQLPREGSSPHPAMPWGAEEGRAPGDTLHPPVSQEAGVQGQPSAPLGEHTHFQAAQPPPKGLLPTPILPPLLRPPYPGERATFPSPPRGPHPFTNPQESFHPGNMQQAMGPFPTFQHPNSGPHFPRQEFSREPPPPFQTPNPVFTRGAPGPRYRFPGQTLPPFSSQPPHPVGDHSPSQQEPPPAPAPKPPPAERLGPPRHSSPDSRERDRSRSHPGRERDGYRGERPQSRNPAERFRRGSEERRRELGKGWERERGWNRDWQRSRERDRSRNREREQDRDRYRRRERDRGRDRDRSREKERDRGRDRGKERERREESKEQEKDKKSEGLESKKTAPETANSKPAS
ncbi:death-inducer obliterator 1-like isoform X2 [Scyliorhinus canicula]|uniref:death-inducer obliterator 1-like isoform X2 n=1 Tax=Scyliorhinus canicula TaxID=7830 RepID=UPI0018F40C01|nr:death-inducer obliterator 1-like isoform X2 [Scyliorhinus canicula]